MVAILLTNAHTILHQPQTSQYFHCPPPTLHEYFHGEQVDDDIMDEWCRMAVSIPNSCSRRRIAASRRSSSCCWRYLFIFSCSSCNPERRLFKPCTQSASLFKTAICCACLSASFLEHSTKAALSSSMRWL
ncbi:hypothetical protein K438DRAFT_1846908, partial [Mycena galopus ATCC 62051]